MDGRKLVLKVTVIGLKVLAFVAVLKPVLVHHATRVVTVLMPPAPGSAYQPPQHRPAYSYYSDVRYLNLTDLQWALLVGVVIYATALIIEMATARILNPTGGAEGRPAV